MATDSVLQKNIRDELLWDPRIVGAGISVSVQNKVATLTGQLDSYAEKIALKQAVERVIGVESLVLNVFVKPPKIHQRSDTEIAAAIEHVFSWSTPVPREKIEILVDNGWVSLSGELDWNFQRIAVERMIRPLKGVVGITDTISLKPRDLPKSASNRIRETVIRQVAREPKNIDISLDGCVITLRGQVQSWAEKNATEGAMWSVPGISKVNSQLTVGI